MYRDNGSLITARWEYRTFTGEHHVPGFSYTTPSPEIVLNELGRDGWDLVSCAPAGSKFLFVLKRPLP